MFVVLLTARSSLRIRRVVCLAEAEKRADVVSATSNVGCWIFFCLPETTPPKSMACNQKCLIFDPSQMNRTCIF